MTQSPSRTVAPHQAGESSLREICLKALAKDRIAPRRLCCTAQWTSNRNRRTLAVQRIARQVLQQLP